MTKLEKLQLFLRFWFSPWGAAKGARWEDFSQDRPFEEHIAETICLSILEGSDADSLNWNALDGFDD